MGYDLHITRRDDWSDQGHDITSDEWLKLIAADPELTLTPATALLACGRRIQTSAAVA